MTEEEIQSSLSEIDPTKPEHRDLFIRIDRAAKAINFILAANELDFSSGLSAIGRVIADVTPAESLDRVMMVMKALIKTTHAMDKMDEIKKEGKLN